MFPGELWREILPCKIPNQSIRLRADHNDSLMESNIPKEPRWNIKQPPEELPNLRNIKWNTKPPPTRGQVCPYFVCVCVYVCVCVFGELKNRARKLRRCAHCNPFWELIHNAKEKLTKKGSSNALFKRRASPSGASGVQGLSIVKIGSWGLLKMQIAGLILRVIMGYCINKSLGTPVDRWLTHILPYQDWTWCLWR